MDLKTQFEQAVVASKAMTTRPDNMTLLKMYGLYKQGSLGDATGERPAMSDFIARAKFDAWQSQSGKSHEQAMQEYLDIFNTLE
jgi:diazepam-binding inhibitor (GABA receptor modulator, acyl-CoA-binding protein)